MIKPATADSRQTEKVKSERLGFGSFELPTDGSYSRTKIRTEFIRAADRLERGVANSLYEEAFFIFVRVVWSQFPQTIPPPVSGLLEDSKFLVELDRVLTDFSASPYNDKSESIHPAFIELFIPVYKQNPELLFNNPRGVLIRELLRPIRELTDGVPRGFRDWFSLQRIRGAGPLRESIVNWSRRWNLDADWCRDYAVAALWGWLADRYLQYQMNYVEGRLSLQQAASVVQQNNIWTAAAYPAFNTDSSLELELSPIFQEYHFTWKGLGFQHYRWNPLSMYRDDWVSECEESFKKYLARRSERGAAVPSGALRKFRADRNEYVRKVERAAERAGLVRTPRRWAYEHLTWAVRFHVQKWPLSKIQEVHSKPRKTIADGIDGVMTFIGLNPKTEKNRRGRKPGKGSTRKLSERETANKRERLQRFVNALKTVDNPENKARVAKAIGISPAQFRKKWVPDLIEETKCIDYGELVRKGKALLAKRGSQKLGELKSTKK